MISGYASGSPPHGGEGSTLRVAESLHYASETAANLALKLEMAAARLEALLDGHTDGHSDTDCLLERIDTLLVLLDQCIRLVSNLRAFIENALYDRPHASDDDNNDDVDVVDDVELEFDLPVGLAQPTILGESVDAIAADVEASLAMLTTQATRRNPHAELQELLISCGMFFSELLNRRTRLARSRQGGDGRSMLEEADVAQGKAAHAMHAIVHASLHLLGRPAQMDAVHRRRRGELVAALQVRGYLMHVRGELLTLTENISDAPDDKVVGLMLTCHHMLDRLRGETAFRALRWPDRYAFSDFSRRIRAWLDGDHDANAAREVLGDLGVYGNLLAEVNRREVLVTHDRRVQRRCLDELRDLNSVLALTTADGWRQLEPILRRLQRMAGRHRPFDALVRTMLEQKEPLPDKLRQAVTALAEGLLSVPF